ncbi:phosphoribosyltransferase family protein [Stenotrophomonas sp. 22385]|uniref:SLOG cluster 4 domain-containing protein n=1 Tax=Stenotrophomonas sp. 22385 TaxID=3453915 RepID=UPI003F85C43D
MKPQIALLGTSSIGAGDVERATDILHQVGRVASHYNASVLTGTGGGISTLAADILSRHGVAVIGVSPSASAEKHETETNEDSSIYGSMIFTGMGFKGRNVTLVRSADVVVAIGGQTGTVNELTIAWDEGKVVALGADTDFLGCAPTAFLELSKQVIKKSPSAALYYSNSVSTSLGSALKHHLDKPTPITRMSVEQLFSAAGAIHHGHFEIKSGHHTTEFWEKAILLENGQIVAELARRLAVIVRRLKPDILVGPPIGGAILAHALGAKTQTRSLFFDKNDSGLPVLARSYRIAKGARVLIVDDIVSAGSTIAAAESELGRLGLHCLGSAVLVDRRGGSPVSDVTPTRHPVHALLTKRTPQNVSEAECVNCAKGDRATASKDTPVILT